MTRTNCLLVALFSSSLLFIAGCSAEVAKRPGVTQSPSDQTSARPTAGADAVARPGADFVSDDGAISVTQVQQMSVVIQAAEGVVYTDPTRGAERYSNHPAPDLILVSHEHAEHFDVATLEGLVGPRTQLIVPPFVLERLPEDLKSNAIPLANGERSVLGGITVEAIPAYGVTGEAERWHPRGRGNGYVVTAGGSRVYIAGSSEATPEMLELDDIYLALLPLYPPYALDPEQAVSAVSSIRPQITYIYQYNSQGTRDAFVQRMADAGPETAVIAPQIAP